MKTGILIVLAALIALAAFPDPAKAQSLMTGRMGVGVRGGYLLPGEDDKLDSSFGFEGLLAYGVTDNLSAELSVGHTRPDIYYERIEGKAQITYFNLTFQLRGEPSPDLGLYFGAGPSLLINKWTGSPGGVRGKDDLGVHLSAGLDYFLTEILVFNLDVKHLWADFKFRDRQNESGKISASSWLLAAGLKVFF